jgi:parallel beta-helix repeat protein
LPPHANRVERSRDVVIWYSSGTVVEDNVVRTSRYGLHYMYSNDNVFRRNRFEDNQVGAAIMYSRGIELTENAFCLERAVGVRPPARTPTTCSSRQPLRPQRDRSLLRRRAAVRDGRVECAAT